MRAFANSVLQRSLVAQSAQPVQFLRLAFGGGDIRITTAPFDVSWDGFTWQGVGGELKLEAINESPDDRGGQFSLGLSGVDQSMLAAILAERYIGRPLDVWLAWIASATNLIACSGGESAIGNTVVAIAGATVTRDTTHVLEGSAAVKIATSATDDGASWRADTSGNAPVVVPGMPYHWMASLYNDSAAGVKLTRLRIEWQNSGGSTVGQSDLDVVVQPGGFQRFAVSGTAPATAAKALPTILSRAGSYNLWVDEAQFGPGSEGQYQPTDGAAIQGGTVIDRPIGPATFFMNGGFEVEEETGRREGRTVKIQAKVSSRSATLLVSRGFRTNRESHQAVYRTDQFFEFVPGLSGKQIVWGSKPYSLGQIAFGNTPYSPWKRG